MDDANQALQFFDRQPSQNHASHPGSVIIAAQLSGTFLQGPQTGQVRDGHIFCYRRNLFHVRGTIIPKQEFSDIQYVQIRATLTATESVKGDDVSLITVPKTNKEDTSSTGPAPTPNDVKVNLRGDSTAPISFSWPRLQFRSATAKGGRRKEKGPEQHFTLHISVFALSLDGSEVLLSEKRSAPIIVRGRSPSNFPSAIKASRDNRELSTGDPPPASSNIDDSTLSSTLPLGYRELETPTFTRDDLAYNNDGLFFDIGTLGSGTESQNIEHSEFLSGDFYFPEDLITISPNLNLDDAEFLSLALPESFPHDGRDSTQSVAVAELSRQEARAEDQTVQPSLATTKKTFSYEYIPLCLNDRTPPVQAVYVGGSRLG